MSGDISATSVVLFWLATPRALSLIGLRHSSDMGKVKVPYYVVKKGRGYWQPTKAMQEFGFASVRCGPDGPTAWAIAEEWNRKWQLERRGLSSAISLTWPKGSLGEAFTRLKKTDQWTRMAPRTREDWERGQKMIEPVFGLVRPRTITLEHVDQFYAAYLRHKGIDAAYRAIKHFRRLWVKMAALGYCDRDADPSKGFNRITPSPRSAVWTEGEAVRLVKTAIRQGYNGLACIIAVAWDTQFSPADVRLLAQTNHDASKGDPTFRIRRAKTSVEAIGTISPRTSRLVRDYLADEPVPAEAALFRNRSGGSYSKDSLGDDFRAVRNRAFPNDTRKLMDMRRSGAIEAAAGEVDPNALAAKMANTINSSRSLQKTYQPASEAAVRLADDARRRGRVRLRDQS